MSVLLDTHALLWWLTADRRLSPLAKATIDDGDRVRYVSSVTAFEIANKHRLGKLPIAGPIIDSFDQIVRDGSFRKLDVSTSHALLAGKFPSTHRDPFDRLLAAQCKIDGLSMITVDPAFGEFGIDIVW